MDCQILEQGGVVTIILPERFQDEKAAVIQQMLMKKFEQGSRQLVVDFSGVVYIDSSGLSVLLALHKQASASGGGVVLKKLNNDVRNFFALTCLDRVFAIE